MLVTYLVLAQTLPAYTGRHMFQTHHGCIFGFWNIFEMPKKTIFLFSFFSVIASYENYVVSMLTKFIYFSDTFLDLYGLGLKHYLIVISLWSTSAPFLLGMLCLVLILSRASFSKMFAGITCPTKWRRII